jgi:hypothetical protein
VEEKLFQHRDTKCVTFAWDGSKKRPTLHAGAPAVTVAATDLVQHPVQARKTKRDIRERALVFLPKLAQLARDRRKKIKEDTVQRDPTIHEGLHMDHDFVGFAYKHQLGKGLAGDDIRRTLLRIRPVQFAMCQE